MRESGLTVSELRLKAHADEHEAEHVDDQVQSAGVEPHAGDEAPSLVVVHHLLPHEGTHLGEPAEQVQPSGPIIHSHFVGALQAGSRIPSAAWNCNP